MFYLCFICVSLVLRRAAFFLEDHGAEKQVVSAASTLSMLFYHVLSYSILSNCFSMRRHALYEAWQRMSCHVTPCRMSQYGQFCSLQPITHLSCLSEPSSYYTSPLTTSHPPHSFSFLSTPSQNTTTRSRWNPYGRAYEHNEIQDAQKEQQPRISGPG